MGPVWAQSFPFLLRSRAPCRSDQFNSCVTPSVSGGPANLPTIMSEGLVGFGHAVHVFRLLDSRPPAIGRIEQLVGQFVDHALLAAATAVGQNPTNSQRRTAVGIDLNRELSVGAAPSVALHFQPRRGVRHGLLEQLDGLVPAFVFQLLHGAIEDVLGGAFLAIPHHGVNELVDQRGLIDRVRQGFTLRDMSFSRHKSSFFGALSRRHICVWGDAKPSASWLRTWSDSACGWRRLRNPACRAPRDSERRADLSRGPRESAQSSAPAGCGRHRGYRSSPRCRWSAAHARPYAERNSAFSAFAYKRVCTHRASAGRTAGPDLPSCTSAPFAPCAPVD